MLFSNAIRPVVACSADHVALHGATRTLRLQSRMPPARAATSAIVVQEVVDGAQDQRLTNTSAPPPPRAFVSSILAQSGQGRPQDLRPGSERDSRTFQLDPSVEQWSDPAKPYSSSKPGSLTEILSIIASAAWSSDALTASYWAYHTARFSFFIAQGVGGLLSHALSEQLSKARTQSQDKAKAAINPDGHSSSELPLARMLTNYDKEFASRLWEAYGTWEQDLAWIKGGVYKLPWDMVTVNRQYSPVNIFNKSMRFMVDSASILSRRVRRSPEPVWLQGGGIYPDYYAKTFHFQTDGWLSDWSASVYEFSTETLFQGRQDAMQRSGLVPISRYISSSRRASTPSSLRLLEVAAGTGRFHTFIKDNWPDMPSVCSDLSPFYLAKARANMREWKRLRQPTRRLGGVEDTGVEFKQMRAEQLDESDESFDIVVSVYLFHELPEDIQRKVAAEMFRVLKPGGLCVLTDSYQRGDRPEWDDFAHRFGDFNEPYYARYVSCDLGALFQEAGFKTDVKYMSSATKTLSFTKPDAAAPAPDLAPEQVAAIASN